MTTNKRDRLCLLLEDQPITRGWMRDMLQQAFPGIRVVECGDLRAAFAWLEEEGVADPPALAVIDLGLPDGSGLEIIRHLRDHVPEARRVVATVFGDDAHLIEAIMAGAEGYILKEESADAMVATLRRIDANEPPLSPSIARRMLSHFAGRPLASDCGPALTRREEETLTRIGRGLTVAETAADMGITPNTAAGYVKTIYQKLGISTRAQAAREAVRRGLS